MFKFIHSILQRLFEVDYYLQWSSKLQKIFMIIALFLLGIGTYIALIASPEDRVQGQAVRIMYVHVPCAEVALLAYGVLMIFSLGYLISRISVFDALAKASACSGAVFTTIFLLTGSIWGKPMWGTWWVWDARLTSSLIMLFVYLGYIFLRNGFENYQKARIVSSYLAIVGGINLPIIHFSVIWWNSIHQPPSLKIEGSTIDFSMLVPLIIMIVAVNFLYVSFLLLHTKVELLERKLQETSISFL